MALKSTHAVLANNKGINKKAGEAGLQCQRFFETDKLRCTLESDKELELWESIWLWGKESLKESWTNK